MRATIAKLFSASPLTAAELEGLFAAMLDGQLSAAQTAAVLTAWHLRGEGEAELAAGARAMRQRAVTVTLPAAVRPVIDNCGTGGDSSGSFNVSTAAAIVAAAGGARVAKHGNRSASGRCGSADLLFAAGFPAELTPQGATELLAATGFTFFFAPGYHPALAQLAGLRRELGIRTVFNLLGPLANPIAPDFQVLGVGAAKYLQPLAATLAELGVRRALVVHGRDGLDEISPVVPTDAVLIEDRGKRLTSLVIDPATLGVVAQTADLAGGDAAENLTLLTALLDGRASRGLADAVALNAAAVLWISGQCADLTAGLALARQLISTKVAQSYFLRWLAEARTRAL